MHFVVGVLIMGYLFPRLLLKKCNVKNYHNYQGFSQEKICHVANAKVERCPRCTALTSPRFDSNSESSALYEYDQFRIHPNANGKFYPGRTNDS